MGLNKKRGRIPSRIKQRAKEFVKEEGGMAYHYACYDMGFGSCPEGYDEKEWEKQKQDNFMFIDCVVKEMKTQNLW